MHIYVWHNPPAPACQGPSGCEASGVKSEVNVILSFIDISYFKYSSNIPSAITIWWSTGQQTGVWQSRGQQAGDIDLLLDALDEQFTLHQVDPLNLGCLWKSMKFQWISNTPTNHQNGLPGPPKVSKMRSQEVPEVIKITNMLKKWKLMKTIVFTILLRGWDIIFVIFWCVGYALKFHWFSGPPIFENTGVLEGKSLVQGALLPTSPRLADLRSDEINRLVTCQIQIW